MTISRDATLAVSHLTASASNADLLPIRKALDKLQQLEREQETLLNREVIARELFIGPVHGAARDDRAKVWDAYLRIEAAGPHEGDGIDPREVLAKRREQADALVATLRSAVAYA